MVVALDDEVLRVCVQHLGVRREPFPVHMRLPGFGDCARCTPHVDNECCLGYYPVVLVVYEVGTKDLNKVV